MLAELEEEHLGKNFTSRRKFERFLKKLQNRPRSTRELKSTSLHFKKSLVNERFETETDLKVALSGLQTELTQDQINTLSQAAYTGWVWTADNFHKMTILQSALPPPS